MKINPSEDLLDIKVFGDSKEIDKCHGVSFGKVMKVFYQNIKVIWLYSQYIF
jgi:hypothetical protein